MFAEFIAEDGVLKGLILSLERGEEWIIGRDPDLSTIVIEDPKAARQHMRVRKIAAGYLIENLSDSTPVLVNGVAISEPTLLREGDLITLGGSLFRFYPKGAPGTYTFQIEDSEDEEESAKEEEEKEEELEESPPPEEQPEKLPEEEFVEESLEQEESPEEEFFDESGLPELQIDLTQTTRFIIKVIAGPNTGAEFALDYDKSYLIGTDTATCDIVFNDLSVSREHARLSVSREGNVGIQDLGSRNGVVVDKDRISGSKILTANAVVALGTSAFLLIDREAPSETIAAPIFEVPSEEEEEVVPEEELAGKEELVKVRALPKRVLPGGTLVLALIIGGLAVLFGIGLVSLFQTKEIEFVSKDYLPEIEGVIKKYPAVQFNFNPSNGKLFLLGHVKTGVEHNELLYQLRSLGFIQGIEDNIVNDEAVWQEMNILLSQHPDFKGVSMHAPKPGEFVISGYLQTEKQASDLVDYLNINFNYLSHLQNKVIVEQSAVYEVNSRLFQQGYGAVTPTLTNGDLQLTGYVNSHQVYAFEKMVEELKKIPGIRNVRNYVVAVTPEQGVIDLNKKYLDRPLRYKVTGSSRHGDVNINVVINGRILTRGDCIDGYTITGIQPHIIFLEKDGLKYKIEYNRCISLGGEE